MRINEPDAPTGAKGGASGSFWRKTSKLGCVALRLRPPVPHKPERRRAMKTSVLVVLMFLWTGIIQTPLAWGIDLSQKKAQAASAGSRISERRQSMKKFTLVLLMFLSAGMVQTPSARGNEFKVREAKIAQYKSWLDTLGPQGSQYWVRLDSAKRPHRLYLGEGFYRADFQSQERFIDTFSNYLAGHPEKFMLIDLFDANTNKAVGEYGFGGFRLYAKPASAGETFKPTAPQHP
jgi:hypothetical protein